MGDFNNQRWLTELLHKVGLDSNWEVDVLEGADGKHYLVNAADRMVLGEITEQAEVVRYETPRALDSVEIVGL